MKTKTREKKANPGSDAEAVRVRLEHEMVEFFVHLAGMLDLPRSVGELYGALFAADAPLTMDALIGRLRISKGATSQGLRKLRAFGAVRVLYVPGDRRDHYVAETELRRLAAGFLREQVRPHLDRGAERIRRMQDLLDDAPADPAVAPLEERVARLAQWRSRADKLLPVIMRLIEH